MDTCIGKILAGVNLTNTHVIFLADNGTANNVIQPPFTNTRAKGTLYEGGTHVPLIIAGPAVNSPNRTNATPVSAVDVYATILEMAGINATTIPTSNPIDGQSLLSVLQTSNLTLSRHAYSEFFGTNILAVSNGGRALRDARYKLIDFTVGADQFYDLAVDPYEKTNLLVTAMNATQLANYAAGHHRLGQDQRAVLRDRAAQSHEQLRPLAGVRAGRPELGTADKRAHPHQRRQQRDVDGHECQRLTEFLSGNGTVSLQFPKTLLAARALGRH
jgi:arylsulfatase A-like enzyme